MKTGALRVSIMQQAMAFQALNHVQGNDLQVVKLHEFVEDIVNQMAKAFKLNKDQMVCHQYI